MIQSTLGIRKPYKGRQDSKTMFTKSHRIAHWIRAKKEGNPFGSPIRNAARS